MRRDNLTRRKALQALVGTSAAFALPTTALTVTATDHENHDAYGTGEDGFVNTDADTPTRDGDWDALQHNRVYIYYKTGYRDDAEKIREYISYAEQYVHALLETDPDHGVEFYVYPNEEWDNHGISTYHNLSTGGPSDEVSIECVAPSENQRFTAQSDREEWYQHNVTKRYAEIPIGRMISNHRGWFNYSDPEAVPEWFRNGVSQYIGELAAPMNDFTAEDFTNRYVEPRELSIDAVTSENENGVDAILVEFLVSEYGWESVMDMLIFEVATFEESLQRELGLSFEEFEAEWIEYAVETYSVEETVDEEPVESNSEPESDREPVSVEVEVEEVESESESEASTSDDDDGTLLMGIGAAAAVAASTAAGYLHFKSDGTDDLEE